jgi:hypothetical protein
VADKRRGCGAGSDSGPDWINVWTGHNRDFTGNRNRHVTGYDHAGLNPDPGNDSAWNCKSDSGDGKSDTRNRSTCAGNNYGDGSNKSDSGNDSGSFDSGNEPHDADSGNHPRNDHAGDYASCG